jgi:hypothetical protein
MQDLLEPQLVRLVHGDEQQLIVMGWIREAILKLD